jgi:hypothetical protein
MKIFQFENFSYKLGQSAEENWCLLDEAKDNNIFFHLSSFPSGYVILSYDGKLTTEILRIGAEICKKNTKYRNIRDLKVDFCYVDNLYKGEKVGEVYFKSNRKVQQIKI